MHLSFALVALFYLHLAHPPSMSSYEFCPLCQSDVCTDATPIDVHVNSPHDDAGDGDLVQLAIHLSLQESFSSAPPEPSLGMHCPNAACDYPFELIETDDERREHINSCMPTQVQRAGRLRVSKELSMWVSRRVAVGDEWCVQSLRWRACTDWM